MNEDVFVELIAFVREQIRDYVTVITKDTLIEDELGVTGDEAGDLILSFAKKYNVDISNFIFANYFYDEPNLFFQNRKIKPFTLHHLEKAIKAGRLDEEVINS